MSASLPDAEARRAIREDLDDTLFVEAAAGTGKTTALVSRIVGLICTGRAELEAVVAVTFTEKAAGEMKLRLRSEIESERRRARESGDVDVTRRLERALAQLELARIGTIHGFCADLLRERPVEARIDPSFEVAAEGEDEELLDAVFAEWMGENLADPPEGIRRVLRRRPESFGAPSPRELLRSAVGQLVQHRDFPGPWRRDPFDREAELDGALEALRGVAALAREATRPATYLAKSFQEIAAFVESVDFVEGLRARDDDDLEGELRRFGRARHWRWKGAPRGEFSATMSNVDARAVRDAAKGVVDRVVAACGADLAPRLREELRPVVEAYAVAKDEAGRLDFLDLLVRARDLVRDDARVRAELQRRFTHFFVDEFQDTDPLQADLLSLLAADDPEVSDAQAARPTPGKLFIVGDPKQSIYRFRRADVSLYESVKRRFESAGARVLQLSASFRSQPAIQDFVNAAFAPVLHGDDVGDGDGEGGSAPAGSQAHYVGLEAVRRDRPEQPRVVALPAPKPYGDYGTPVRWKIDESYADAVGAYVDWLVTESGWQVEDPTSGELVPVAPRHVCILFRRFQSFRSDVTRPYARALEARRVPHVLVGGKSFHEREEVLALRNALVAIEWPDDELRVFAALRGPFFAIHDDLLLAFRERYRRLHPLAWLDEGRRAALESEDERIVAEALAVLGELHGPRNRRPLTETVTQLLGALRVHAGLAIWPTGEQALGNCLRVVELARSFERRRAGSFRAFVEALESEAERGRSEEAPVVEEGSEGVRIMTVHKAKGLEFPVVILADPGCQASRDLPSRHVDAERGVWAEALCGAAPPELAEAADAECRRDAAEALRVAYVAATRARDLLVLPVVGDLGPEDEAARGWLEVLNPVAYPADDRRGSPKAAAGCPAFGRDTVAYRPGDARRSRLGPVRPGRHPGAGDVVWWDPTVLDLDAQQEVGLRQQKALQADDGNARADRGEASHREWRRALDEALRSGAVVTQPIESVTARAAGAAGDGASPTVGVTVEAVAGDRKGRPTGRRFGTLVHAVLAELPIGDEDAAKAVASLAAARGRQLGATVAEVDAAARAVGDALGHPVLRAAAVADREGRCHREESLAAVADDGTLVEGIVDLAFLEDDGEGGERWVVVDFKTDRELSEALEAYERQVADYAAILSRATGVPARALLLHC